MKIKNLLSIVAIAAFVLMLGCSKDDDNDSNLAPTVLSTDPATNATDVVLNKIVTVTFSEDMDPLTLTAETFTISQGATPVTGTVSYSGTTASFEPSAVLTPNTVYTATITNGAKDVSGMALKNDYVWTFTTTAGTILAPTVVSTSPLNSAVDVALNKIITATFSEDMESSTINASSFTLKDGETIVNGDVTYSGMIARFTPTNSLKAGTVYSVMISTEVENLDGISLAGNKAWSFTTGSATASISAVDLGTAGNYVILAKTAINNTPTSDITGDLGLSPAAATLITGLSLTDFTGYATSAQVTGQVFAADMADPTPANLTTAVENMITAYDDAAGRVTPDFLELGTGNIGGEILDPGLYKWTTTVTLPTEVTISGGADDIWIFQISGDLNVSADVNVILEGGAQAKNIFWQVAGEAIFGATSHFEGIILSMTGITFQTDATFNGRALAQTAVIMDSNIIVEK